MKIYSSDELKARWIEQLDVAQATWSKISEAELRDTDGHTLKLAALIERRYEISREEAEKQIKKFFTKS